MGKRQKLPCCRLLETHNSNLCLHALGGSFYVISYFPESEHCDIVNCNVLVVEFLVFFWPSTLSPFYFDPYMGLLKERNFLLGRMPITWILIPFSPTEEAKLDKNQAC